MDEVFAQVYPKRGEETEDGGQMTEARAGRS